MAVRGPVREVKRSLIEFTPSKLDAPAALRCALGIAIPLAAGLLLDRPELGGAAAIGAWSAGLTTFHNDARPRPLLAVLAGAVMGLGVLIGGHTGAPALTIAVAVVWCFAAGLVGSTGEIVGTVATVCGTSIFLANGLTIANAPETAALATAAGGALQALVTALLPRHRHRSERRALSGAYHWLAEEARAIADDVHVPPRTAPLELAEQVLVSHRDPPEVFLTALTHARRLRAVLTAVGAARGRILNRDATAARHIAAVLREAAGALDVIAEAIAEREAPAADWYQRLRDAVRQVEADTRENPRPVTEYDVKRLQSLIRAAAATAATPTVEIADDGEPSRMDASRWRLVPVIPPMRAQFAETLESLRAKLSWRSTDFRQSGRTALGVGIATAGGMFWPGEHGYWIPLTAWIVLKADFAGTLGRGVGRTIGTAFGALVAGLLSSLLPVTPLWIVPVVTAFAFLAYLLFRVSFTAYSAGVAGFVVFNIELGGASPVYAAQQRVAATLAGGLFALVYFLLWPKWETPRLAERLAELTDRYAAYADAVLARHADPSRRREGALRSILDELRLARAEVEAAIPKAAAEPVTAPGPMSAEAAAIAAALGRAVRPFLVLEAHLPDPDAPALPPVDGFRTAVSGVYAEYARRLRGGEPDRKPLNALRSTYDTMTQELDDDVIWTTLRKPTRRRRTLYRWEGDVIVDALETVGEHIIGRK